MEREQDLHVAELAAPSKDLAPNAPPGKTTRLCQIIAVGHFSEMCSSARIAVSDHGCSFSFDGMFYFRASGGLVGTWSSSQTTRANVLRVLLAATF